MRAERGVRGRGWRGSVRPPGAPLDKGGGHDHPHGPQRIRQHVEEHRLRGSRQASLMFAQIARMGLGAHPHVVVLHGLDRRPSQQLPRRHVPGRRHHNATPRSVGSSTQRGDGSALQGRISGESQANPRQIPRARRARRGRRRRCRAPRPPPGRARSGAPARRRRRRRSRGGGRRRCAGGRRWRSPPAGGVR